jgi:hypothetical protein
MGMAAAAPHLWRRKWPFWHRSQRPSEHPGRREAPTVADHAEGAAEVAVQGSA